MTEQEMVDRFARAAGPRFAALLRLKAEHFYDSTPGQAGSTILVQGKEIRLKLKRTTQPYGDIERFATDEKEMGFVINPGLLPLVKAIILEIRGRPLLVTRRIADAPGDKGVVAHMQEFGVRVMLYREAGDQDTHISWECLYGVA